MMRSDRARVRAVVGVLCAAVLFSCTTTTTKQQAKSIPPAYVDPAVREARGSVPVIVAARRTSAAAASAVLRAGGTVKSDLWIIDAVEAIVPARNISRLASDPAVTSIIENKKVNPAEWGPWVSDIRLVKGTYPIPTGDTLYTGPSHTPNGGFAQITTNGQLIIVNPDGSERKRVQLTTGGPFYSPAVADSTGRIFVGAVYGCMYAVSPDGTNVVTNCSMLNTNYFYAKPVIASDGTVVVVTYYGTAYGFDPATLSIRWQQSLTRNNAQYKTAPMLGPDDTMYVSSQGGDVSAVSVTGGIKWIATVNGNAKGNYAGATPTYSNGVVYVSNGSVLVAYAAETGKTIFSFNADTTLIGSPAIAPDGNILLTTSNSLYSLTPAGQLQWKTTPAGYNFTHEPLISGDNTTVYAGGETAKGKSLSFILGFHRATGASKFTYQVADGLASATILDADGGVVFAGKTTSVYRVGQDGAETHRIKTGANTIAHLSQSSMTGNFVMHLNSSPLTLMFCGRFPNEWNGRADVEEGSNPAGAKLRWKLTYPYSIDVGADQLHTRTLPGTQTFIQGSGVGVAVIDSGVYWDTQTKKDLGAKLQQQFMGQADFVDPICASTGCLQQPDHAFYDHNNSRDPYGHGTHVAGTISSNLLNEVVSQGQNSEQVYFGIAPDSKTLSVRVLGPDGTGSYAGVIKGIQYVIDNKARYNVRVMNLSLSAYSRVPYFVDPLCRAVEKAWQAGIVVLAAAGNTGPFAQSITSPGISPYVITVGAVNSRRTAAYWRDDVIAPWSASGPTFDGFAKPDVVAPGAQIVSFMYRVAGDPNTAYLATVHPDYSQSSQLFRMNGTSMATAVASGVVALIVQANPSLTPDQVKYRLVNSARLAWSEKGNDFVYNTLRQGMGRVWAPDAVLAPVTGDRANAGLDINRDLAAKYDTVEELAQHYQGPIRRMLSSDGQSYGYYATDTAGRNYLVGVTDLNGNWRDVDGSLRMIWGNTSMTWSGGMSFTGDTQSIASMRMIWGNSTSVDPTMRMIWGNMRMIWGNSYNWAEGSSWLGGQAWSSMRMIWGNSGDAWSSARMIWGNSLHVPSASSETRWIEDNWIQPSTSSLPPPAAVNP